MSEKRQTPNNNASNIESNSKEPVKQFTNFDIICIFLSMGSFVLDFSTDVILAAEYWHRDHLVWSLNTFLLILVPAILIQLFSMRWHLMDESVSLWHWMAHLCLVGVLHRYGLLLKMIIEMRKSKSSADVEKVYIQHSDICMLHLFETFLQATPQFILQTYIITVTTDWHILTVISTIASLCSLYCGVFGYMRALRRARQVSSYSVSTMLQVIWKFSMVSARLAALFMFVVAFKHWILLLLSVHWFVMVIWIVYQKTDFCPTQSEEVLYNCVVGVIYCFCFFNLRVGQARYRMIIFYSIMVSENILCLLLFLFIAPSALRKDVALGTASIIVGGTCLGIISMLIYYRWLHPSGPLKWWLQTSPQTSTTPPDKHNDTTNTSVLMSPNTRTLKTVCMHTTETPDKKPHVTETPQIDAECTDKKHLLDQWGGLVGNTSNTSPKDSSMDNTIDNTNVTGIEFYSVTNSPEKSALNVSDGGKAGLDESTLKRSKRRGICSTMELGVKFTKANIDNVSNENKPDMTAQKRRGICSSGQLKDELINDNNFVHNMNPVRDNVSEDGDGEMCNGKTSSDSFNLDLDLSFSDINSSDINEFNENIVQKLCLSTLKNIKNVHQDADIRNIQKIALEILKDLYSKGGIKDDQDLESELSSSIGRDLETPSEALSAHDYENICAVNIAREAWGLRSWRGCYDMGVSSPPPPPLPHRNPHLPPSPHHHYIRTVAYELAKCEDSCQLTKNNEYHKESEAVFVAKPYVVDASEAPLEPILEELDDIIESSGTMKARQRHGSESALVATIDEIRNDTVTDSPRNVYHRGDWDSPCINYENEYKTHVKQSTSLRKSLWREEFTHNKTQATEVDSGNNKASETKKRVTISENPSIINDVVGRVSCHVPSAGKIGNNYVNKRTCNNPQAHFQKKNLDKKIYENQKKDISTIPLEVQYNSDSSLTLHQPDIITGSLQNLINRDCKNISSSKPSGDCKAAVKQRHNNSNRPRRKFSLLREKFEPKSGHSDEEMLFQSLESVRSLSHNDLDIASSHSCLKNNIVLVNQEPKVIFNKENLLPKSKIPHVPNDGVVLSLTPCSIPEDSSAITKDKPSLFLKQVLNPPKINNWARKNISEYVN